MLDEKIDSNSVKSGKWIGYYCDHCGLKMTIDTTGLEDVCQ